MYATKPILETPDKTAYAFGPRLQKLIGNVIDQWILPLPQSNPAMLDMFNDRNKQPYRGLLPFSGEFAGKYLTGSAQIYRLSHDPRLAEHLDWFVGELARAQAEDGYLGPWPDGHYLTGEAPNCRFNFDGDNRYSDDPQRTWDAWDEYHLMLGLISWHNQSGNMEALRCSMRIADLLCDRFLTGEKRLGSIGWQEMNLAPIHAFCLLNKRTGDPRYLAMAHRIEEDFSIPPAGDYINTALAGMEFYRTPKPRWESLYSIQAVAELYLLTGEMRYRQAYEHIWWSIVKTDRHNTGGFSTNEQAVGNPYAAGPIETCCTAAWIALGIDMLRINGTSIVADELELSTFNAGLGSMSSAARWWTYDTPMDGYRKSFYEQHIHARPGNPEFSCCAATGPKLLGMLGEWALMRAEFGYAINYYGPVVFDTALPSGNRLRITQATDYPANGKITISIALDAPERFSIKLRIPYWSVKSVVSLNGEDPVDAESGSYFELDKVWGNGDTINISLDMSLHYWLGEDACSDRCSIYRGPILLAYDQSLNDRSSSDFVPEFDAWRMRETAAYIDYWYKPWLAYAYETTDGKCVTLCDFSSAGQRGRHYRSWLKVRNVSKQVFTKNNPLRSARTISQQETGDQPTERKYIPADEET